MHCDRRAHGHSEHRHSVDCIVAIDYHELVGILGLLLPSTVTRLANTSARVILLHPGAERTAPP